MKFWAWDEKNLPSITHAIRTAVAATASVERVSFGEDRISLRKYYPHHHRSNSALGCTVDSCFE